MVKEVWWKHGEFSKATYAACNTVRIALTCVTQHVLQSGKNVCYTTYLTIWQEQAIELASFERAVFPHRRSHRWMFDSSMNVYFEAFEFVRCHAKMRYYYTSFTGISNWERNLKDLRIAKCAKILDPKAGLSSRVFRVESPVAVRQPWRNTGLNNAKVAERLLYANFSARSPLSKAPYKVSNRLPSGSWPAASPPMCPHFGC